MPTAENFEDADLREMCARESLDALAEQILSERLIGPIHSNWKSRFHINYDTKDGDFVFTYVCKGKNASQ